MGAETYFYARTTSHPVVVRSHAEADHAVIGRRLTFALDPAKVHLFSGSSGERLR